MKGRTGRILLLAVVIGTAACAPLSEQPGPSAVRLIKMEAPTAIQAGVPYEVLITFESDRAPRFSRACFHWSAVIQREGPYCFPVREVTAGPAGTFRVQLVTRNPRRYKLDGYAEYFVGLSTHTTNEVTAMIDVRN